MITGVFDRLLERLSHETLRHYDGRLVALAVFGSVARRTMSAESDIDLLVVADDLPDGRMPRVRAFAPVEHALAADLAAARDAGVHTSLSPVFYARDEVKGGSPIFLDMTEEVIILFDRDHFLRDYLAGLAGRLAAQGARRVGRGKSSWWILTPAYRPGQKIEL